MFIRRIICVSIPSGIIAMYFNYLKINNLHFVQVQTSYIPPDMRLNLLRQKQISCFLQMMWEPIIIYAHFANDFTTTFGIHNILTPDVYLLWTWPRELTIKTWFKLIFIIFASYPDNAKGQTEGHIFETSLYNSLLSMHQLGLIHVSLQWNI